MEHNYNNLHKYFEGDDKQIRDMVHNGKPCVRKTAMLGNILGGFVSILIGISVLNAVTNSMAGSLRKSGLA